MPLKWLLYIVGIVLLLIYIQSAHFQNVVDALLPFKLLAAFLGGILYTSFLTTPISLIIFIALATKMDPFLLALVGGLGAMVVDLLLVKTFQKFSQFLAINTNLHYSHRTKSFLKKYHLNILAIVLGALIVMSPIPDEVGLVLLGAGRFNSWQLSLLLFGLDFVGIYMVAEFARAIV